jgi:hypothetical protein
LRGLILGSLLFMLGQSLIWIQTNGQFVWPWFKRNPWPVAIVMGSIISYILIKATGLVVGHFDGALWPSRFIGFSTGIITFAALTYLFLGEGINMKTTISLALAFGIICVQLFMK